MRFELVNAQRTCELSRKAFVRMLSGALEISDDFSQGNSFDGYTCKRKKFWLFLDLASNQLSTTIPQRKWKI